MTAIISKHGQLLFTISGNADTIALNTPEGCFAVDDPPRSGMIRTENVWEDIPQSPSPHHEFDYAARRWIDNRTLEQIKEHAWEVIKQQRDALEFGGFEFGGNIYDSDQVSQGRIMGAAMAGLQQTWTLADNTTVDLSAEQLEQLYVALQMHVAAAHERGRIARTSIDTASSKAEVDAIVL